MANTLEDRLNELNTENDTIMATSNELIASNNAVQEKNLEYAQLSLDFKEEIDVVKSLGLELISLTEDMIIWVQTKNDEANVMSSRLDAMKTIMRR